MEIKKRQRSLISFLRIVIAMMLTAMLVGQEGVSSQDKAPPPLKLDTLLVQVPVTVSDLGGRYVTDLRREDFTIFEDGIKQEIEFFAPVDESLSIALLIDSSGSTAEQLSIIKKSAVAFVDNLRDDDRVIVISFNDSVEIMCELTSNREVIRQAIDNIRSGEFTQVYEAVYTAVWERLRLVEGRKAVIVFSDGIDTASSEISDEDTLDAVVESEDTLVYPIRYNTGPDVKRKLGIGNRIGNLSEPEDERLRKLDQAYRKADEYMHLLATLSGGVVEYADSVNDLRAVFARIATELRRQYLLGYYPVNRQTSKRDRKIFVEVNRKGVRVRARPSYRMNKDKSLIK